MKIINSGSVDTYLVTFQNSISTQYICAWENLHEALKPLQEGLYLGDIYRYDSAKKKFSRVPKNKYELLFNMNTEAFEILKKYL